jgi:hypothetical protein
LIDSFNSSSTMRTAAILGAVGGYRNLLLAQKLVKTRNDSCPMGPVSPTGETMSARWEEAP